MSTAGFPPLGLSRDGGEAPTEIYLPCSEVLRGRMELVHSQDGDVVIVRRQSWRGDNSVQHVTKSSK